MLFFKDDALQKYKNVIRVSLSTENIVAVMCTVTCRPMKVKVMEAKLAVLKYSVLLNLGFLYKQWRDTGCSRWKFTSPISSIGRLNGIAHLWRCLPPLVVESYSLIMNV